MVLATLDPAIPEHRVVLRMDRIHEADDVVLVLVLLELFVLGKQRLLGLRVGLAGDQLGLLVDEAEAMQQGGHAAGGVSDGKLLLDSGRNVLGGEIPMVLRCHSSATRALSLSAPSLPW